jgi:hypothetical protein
VELYLHSSIFNGVHRDNFIRLRCMVARTSVVVYLRRVDMGETMNGGKCRMKYVIEKDTWKI